MKWEHINKHDGEHTLEVGSVKQWSQAVKARQFGNLGKHILPVLNSRLDKGEWRVIEGWAA